MNVRFLVAVVMLGAASSAAADPELAMYFGRATGSKDIDVVRLAHRRALAPDDAHWWWPTYLQLGASIWWVPDISGKSRRFDFNATPVWRADRGRAYLEAGIGPYLLSHTVNNGTTRLPSALQFGSHVAAGLRLGGEAAVGIALQHLSNAGIKQPNGGIDFVVLTASFPL